MGRLSQRVRQSRPSLALAAALVPAVAAAPATEDCPVPTAVPDKGSRGPVWVPVAPQRSKRSFGARARGKGKKRKASTGTPAVGTKTEQAPGPQVSGAGTLLGRPVLEMCGQRGTRQ